MPEPISIDERLNSLEQLISLVEHRSLSDYEFKRATGSLANDVQFISKALRRDPNLWRMNRSFHAVHVPSFLAIVSMLDNIDDMKSVNDDDRHQIYSSVHRAVQLASKARERIEQSALLKTQVEVEVLADYAPASTEKFQKATVLERAREGLFSVSKTTFDSTKTTVEAIPNLAGLLRGGVTNSLNRANAVLVLASNLQRTFSGTLSDTLIKPIGMRLQASGKALAHGTGAGVGLGVMAAVLFPPLVPVSAGAGILVALRSWKKEVQKAQSLNERQREQRIAELEAERKTVLLQLTNGAPSVQMETDELSLTLNAETGEADALILKGEYAGRTWSDLSPLEKAETVSLFAQGADVILKILELGSENL